MNPLTEPELHAQLKLVRAIAHATRTSLEYDDRCQEGYLGLDHAIRNFDEAKSPSFASYARKCIRGFILHGTVKACNQFGLSQKSFWTRGPVTQVHLDGLPDYQRDQLLGASPEPEPDRLELRRRLARAMATLKAREQKVLRLRFGWDGRTPMTRRAVGKRLGITAEYVRQLEGTALGKLELLAFLKTP